MQFQKRTHIWQVDLKAIRLSIFALGLLFFVTSCGDSNNSTIEWRNEAYLKAQNSESNDQFGYSVSISGDTVVIGAFQEDSNQTTITNGSIVSDNDLAGSSGAAYVFKRSGNTWTQEAYLKAPNAQSSDYFGYPVSISGDTIVVGAYGEDSNQTTITNGSGAITSDNSNDRSGAAYVFKRSGSTWAQEAYLKASNNNAANSLDHFGYSLEISGDTIVVGAYQEDSNQSTITNGTTTAGDVSNTSNYGAAYVFKRSGSTWTQEAYLKAPNAEPGDYFGGSVSISGDTIAVGAYQEDSNQTTITNSTSVTDNDVETDSGAVYVFKRTSTTWAHEAYLKAPNAEAGDYFGWSVSMSGDTIAVGAYQEDSDQTTITNGTLAGQASDSSINLRTGAVYIFKRSETAWSNEAYIKAPNAATTDLFGYAVSLSGDRLLVGSFNEDSNQTTITNGTTASTDNSASDAGAAYLFKRSGTSWEAEAYIKAPNAEAGDLFGTAVALSSDTVVVAAPFEDSDQTTITNGNTASADNTETSSGAVYVFRFSDN